jgi:hypothetical protein
MSKRAATVFADKQKYVLSPIRLPCFLAGCRVLASHCCRGGRGMIQPTESDRLLVHRERVRLAGAA